MINATLRGFGPRLPATAAILVVVLLLLVPYLVTSSVMFRIGAAVTAGLLALSFNLLLGSAGLLSFGHAAFFAIGGYTIGLALNAGMSWPLALTLSTIFGALIGALFSVVVLRLSGVFFSVLTLGLGEIVHIILLQWTEVTGGDNGLAGISAGSWLGLNLDDSVTYYWVVVIVAVLAAWVLKLVTDSRFGRTLAAIREDDVRAAYLGVPVRRYRAVAYTLSAAVAALAGALFAPLVGLMVPDSASWSRSAEPILAALLGGTTTYVGPLIGVAVFATLDYFARDLASLRIVLTGALLLMVILIAPGGITGTVKKWLGRGKAPSMSVDEEVPAIEQEGADK